MPHNHVVVVLPFTFYLLSLTMVPQMGAHKFVGRQAHERFIRPSFHLIPIFSIFSFWLQFNNLENCAMDALTEWMCARHPHLVDINMADYDIPYSTTQVVVCLHLL